MTRILLVCTVLVVGCNRKSTPSAAPSQPARAPENPAVMAARRNAPVLDRGSAGPLQYP